MILLKQHKRNVLIAVCTIVIFFSLFMSLKQWGAKADTDPIGGETYTPGRQASTNRGCWPADTIGYGSLCDINSSGSATTFSACGVPGGATNCSKFVTNDSPSINTILDCDKCKWDKPPDPTTCATTGGANGTGAYDCSGVNWGSCSGNGASSTRSCPQAAGQNCSETSHTFSRTCCTTDTWTYSYAQCTTIGNQARTATIATTCADDTVVGVTHDVNHTPIPQTRNCEECADLVNGAITNYKTCEFNATGKCISNKIQDRCSARNNDACVPKSLPITITIASSCKNCGQNLNESSATGSNPYTSNCTTAANTQCSAANSTYKVTCTSTDLTCSNASHDFYPTCPNCTYNTGDSCTDSKECDPTKKTPQKTTWQCNKQSSNPSYCKGSAFITEQRDCRTCVESDIYTCTSWGSCSNGKKTRTCTKKTGLSTGNPNCALPSDCNGADCSNKFGIIETTTGCTSCADSDYASNCSNYSSCNGFSAASGIYTATCSSSRSDCTGTRDRSFTPCPECTYATGAKCTEQGTKTCDPTKTDATKQKYDCSITDTREYCYQFANKTKVEERDCRVCTESDLYENCGDWSSCSDGQQKRTCSKKSVNVGSPNCKLPASQKNTDGTNFGQNTKGCGAPPGSGLPAIGEDGSTMFSIAGTWGGSQMIHYDYANKRIGIGTIAPNERLEISGDGEANITSRLVISDTDLTQKPNASNGWSSNNPEFRLKYGSGANDHWALYVEKADLVTNNSLRIWNGDDLVKIDRDGKIHVTELCFGNGQDDCKTTWVGLGGGGPTSGVGTLNGLTDTEQGFAKNNDTNVTLSIASATANSKGTHTFTLGWTGVLGADRGGLGLALTDTAKGTTGNLLRVKDGGTAWEVFTPDYFSPSNPSGGTAGQFLQKTGVDTFAWADESDPTTKALTIDKDGNVSVGAATPAELKVSRFVVKTADTKNGLYVGFQGDDTSISTSPYPLNSTAAIKIDFQSPVVGKGNDLTINSNNTITIKYYVTNPGVKKLHDISITDEKCNSNAPITDHEGDSTTVGVSNYLDPMDSSPGKGASSQEKWVFTCTTEKITTNTESKVTVSGKDDTNTAITETVGWKTIFETLGPALTGASQSAGGGAAPAAPTTPASAPLWGGNPQ